MSDYAHESVTEDKFLRDAHAPRVVAASVPVGTAVPPPERSLHRRLLAGDAPRLTVNLSAVGAYQFAPSHRARSPLTPVLFIILAFALGALVSLWLFNRARAAAPLPRAHMAAPDTTSNASHLAESSAVDINVSERSIASAAEPRAADVKDSAGTDDKRPAPTKDVRPNNSARENILATPPTKPSALRAIPKQTISQKITTGGGCALSTSKSKLTLRGGSSAEIAVSLGSLSGPAPIAASTSDWANIVVFTGARRGGVSTYRIVSVSQRPGTYGVTLRSPCGTKQIAVIVE